MNVKVSVTPYILTYNVFAYTTRLCIALCRIALHKSDNVVVVVVVVAAAAAAAAAVVVVVSIIFHYYNHHHHHGYVSEHLPTEQRS